MFADFKPQIEWNIAITLNLREITISQTKILYFAKTSDHARKEIIDYWICLARTYFIGSRNKNDSIGRYIPEHRV